MQRVVRKPQFKDEEIAGASVKALKQRLAQEIDISRFRLELLEGTCQLRDDQTLPPRVVQLVIQKFWPPVSKIRRSWWHVGENDDTLLEKHLNQPRSPNFQDANQITPLYAAASGGSLKCVLLLLEAGAENDKGRVDTGETPLFIAAQNGHFEVVQFLVKSNANFHLGLADKWGNASFSSCSEWAP